MLIWGILIPIFGQLGIIATLINEPKNSFIENINSGNFYTFSIALLASSILTLAIQLMNDSQSVFKTFKIGSIIMAFLIIVIMVIKFVLLDTISFGEGVFQIILYIFSLILSVYFLCVEYIVNDYENYKDLDDAAINSLFHKTREDPDTDGRGINL